MRISNSDRLSALRGKQAQELDARKAEFEIEKIKAEVEAKALQERANEDVAIRKLQVRCIINYLSIVTIGHVDCVYMIIDAIQIRHPANG